MDAEIELMFGALAVQAGHISASQLLAACEFCRSESTESLPQVLVERNWISPQVRADLDRLVQERLQQHQGNARAALSGFSDATTREALRALEEQEVLRTVPHVSSNEITSLLETMDWRTDSRSRYTLTRVQGKGGLGLVWLAHDEHLNRDVALKEVLPAIQNDTGTVARLLKEAQITGQLEHPNIVPVYELARGPDQRPFYTMRFLRGRSLSYRIKEYHRRRQAGTQGPLELRELLTCFVTICHAIAYAHARGVIHRDLKPQNVMLGDFGEVMVVDWGLAKLVKQPDEDVDRRKILVSSAAGTDATQEGKLMGSPGYMAPEQADGQISLLDERTDIYGLGAVLFAILAGHAPHKGTQTGNAVRDTMSLVKRISEGPTPRLRAGDATIPKPLDAICARAMAKRRSQRYASASELAEDMNRWLADEPVSAYRATRRERAMRWLRHHRTFAQTAAAALVLVTLVTSIAAVAVYRALDAEQAAHQKAEQALAAERLAKAEATRRFREALATTDRMTTGVSDLLQFLPGSELIRRQLLEVAASDYARFAQEENDDPQLRLEAGRTLLRLGDVRRLLEQYDQAAQAYRAADAVFAKLAGAIPQSPEYRLELALTQARLGVVFTSIGPHASADEHFRKAEKILDGLYGRAHDRDRDHFRYEQAGVLINHALLLNKTNQHKAARDKLEQAEEELTLLDQSSNREKYGARLAKARGDLGQQLLMMGMAGAAVAKIEAAIATYGVLATLAKEPLPYLEGLAAARISLANAQRILGRDAEVLATYEASIKDYATLLVARPTLPYYSESLATARMNYALMLHVIGRNTTAKEQAMIALPVLTDLVNRQSDVHRYHEEYAACVLALGLILRDLDEDVSAEVAFRKAMDKFKDLVDAVKDVPEYRRRLANSMHALGRMQHKAGKLAEAEASYLGAIEQFQKAIQAGLDDPYTHDPLAWCYTHLGDLLRQKGEADKARAFYAKALDERETLQTHAEHIHSYGWFLSTCDDAQFRNPDRAIRLAQQANLLAPDNPRYANGLGMAYYRAGKWDESIQCLKEAEKLRPQPSSYDAFILAMAYSKKANQPEASACFERANQLMKQNSPGNIELIKLHAEAAQVMKVPVPK